MKKHFSLFLLFSFFVLLLSASCNDSDDQQGIDPPPANEPETPPIEDSAEPVTRAITIDMFDSGGNGGNGWGGSGALRVNVNGIDIAAVKVNANGTDNIPVGQKKTNTYAFQVATGDEVKLYWIAGTSQGENSFIAYYTDTLLAQEFNSDNNLYWNGENALVYKLRGTMNNISGGELLGSFTVTGN